MKDKSKSLKPHYYVSPQAAEGHIQPEGWKLFLDYSDNISDVMNWDWESISLH